jgi:(S)-ureidoglycine aminohydrolase
MLLTPPNRYPSQLPYLPGGTSYKLVSPRFLPARFAVNLIELNSGGGGDPWPSGRQHFIYVISGDATWQLGDEIVHTRAGGWLYAPPNELLVPRKCERASVVHFQKHYEPLTGVPAPPPSIGQRCDTTAQPTATPGLSRQELLESGRIAADFAISVMLFEPGAALGQVEIHDEEHGLLMLGGSGVYELGRHRYAVASGDFIYMAPYCPQHFAAGTEGATYLLYKDANRDRW